MKLICGLGNPGTKYDTTRHNVGFYALDELAELLDARIYINRNRALTGQAYLGSEKLLLVKPLTYMNLSGEAIVSLASYYKIEAADILVLCDDVNLPLGQLRIRNGGSAGGHNGLKNIIQLLGSDQFPRIRIGVGPQPEGLDLIDFVLMSMTAEQLKEARQAAKKAAQAARMLIESGPQAAMNAFNQRIMPHGEKL